MPTGTSLMRGLAILLLAVLAALALHGDYSRLPSNDSITPGIVSRIRHLFRDRRSDIQRASEDSESETASGGISVSSRTLSSRGSYDLPSRITVFVRGVGGFLNGKFDVGNIDDLTSTSSTEGSTGVNHGDSFYTIPLTSDSDDSFTSTPLLSTSNFASNVDSSSASSSSPSSLYSLKYCLGEVQSVASQTESDASFKDFVKSFFNKDSTAGASFFKQIRSCNFDASLDILNEYIAEENEYLTAETWSSLLLGSTIESPGGSSLDSSSSTSSESFGNFQSASEDTPVSEEVDDFTGYNQEDRKVLIN